MDGVVASSADIQKINPDQIEYMSILKGETAVAKYGDKGINGVIEITTKKGKVSTDKQIGLMSNSKPIIIVDGVEYKGNLKDISSDSISKMEVFKGDDAIEKYGEKGKNGVIAITTNKK